MRLCMSLETCTLNSEKEKLPGNHLVLHCNQEDEAGGWELLAILGHVDPSQKEATS